MKNMLITIMCTKIMGCNMFRSLRYYHQGVCTSSTCVYNNT